MSDGNGNNNMPEGFVIQLRQMMQTWGWTPEEIETSLPRFVRILVDLGMLRKTSDGSYEPTERVEEDEAWSDAWARLEKEGVGGSKPAS